MPMLARYEASGATGKPNAARVWSSSAMASSCEGSFGFSTKSTTRPVESRPRTPKAQDCEGRGFLAGDGLDGDRQVGAALAVGTHEPRDVHQVELIAREDEDLRRIEFEQPEEGLAHGVGRPLIPVAPFERLLGRQDVDETVAEGAEAVGLRDVAVQAGAVELGDDEDAVDPRVQAIADRDVDQPELPSHRHGRLRAVGGERPEAGPLPPSENGCDDFLHDPPPRRRGVSYPRKLMGIGGGFGRMAAWPPSAPSTGPGSAASPTRRRWRCS